MAQGHKYYQPTEYEAQMIAAGLLSPGDVDSDYLEYVKKAPYVADGDVMDYAAWQSCKRQWDELNADYEAEMKLYCDSTCQYPVDAPADVKKRANALLRDMGWLETILAY